MKRSILPMILLILFPFSALADLKVKNAYIPQLPPSSMVHAAYMTITNSGTATRTLIGVKSEAFSAAHIHHTRVKNGVATMNSMHQLDIKPGTSMEFKPGEMHIMLMKAGEKIVAGKEIPLVLEFKNGETVITFAKVRTAE
ncbi:MAG: copper chaperone PCu(A)C [Granulosicoccus sp.]|nr:copper chaperone PCu(A)C [Granulosicoccus sp.]